MEGIYIDSITEVQGDIIISLLEDVISFLSVIPKYILCAGFVILGALCGVVLWNMLK